MGPSRRAWHHPVTAGMLFWLLLMLAGPAWPEGHAATPTLQRLDRVEVRHVDGAAEPPTPHSLPFHWDILAPGQSAQLVLVMRFAGPSEGAEAADWSVLIPRLGNAWQLRLNGQRLASAGNLQRPNDHWAAKRPVWLGLPAALLQPTNELEIRLRADAGRRAGLSRVWVGPSAELLPRWQREEWRRVTLPQAASVLSLTVAALCALLWVQQHASLYAWAAVGELAWALRLADTWWEASPLPWPAWAAAVLALIWIWTGSLYGLIGALAETPRPPTERRLQATVLTLGPIAFALAWALHQPWPVVAAMLVSLLFWSGLNARLARDAWRSRNLSMGLIAVALALCLLAIARDIYAGRASALHYEETAWTKYAAITLALSVLVIVTLRFQQARQALIRLNASIAQQLAEREAQLQTQHDQVTALERARAAAEERTRILRDMHDGAGAHLITAIRLVESGQGSRAELLQTLQESLDQLRLSIDAMHLPAGDINALLSSLRFRLDKRLQAAGLRLAWQVDELPLLPHYPSTQLRHVQFILLEAISNAIQHAQADRLTLRAVADDTHIVLTLQDNGVGPGAGSGNGLRSMQERAALIGATLERPAVAQGTCWVLHLPLHPANHAAV